MSDPRIGYSFLGGGMAGCYQVGLPTAMRKRNRNPVLVQGVSVGALNAAKLVECNGDPEPLRAIWKRIEVDKRGAGVVFAGSALKNVFLHDWLYNGDALRQLIDENIDPIKILGSPIDLQLIVFNQTKDRSELITNRDPSLRENPKLLLDYIQASSSLPKFFPPVVINGQLYSDGYWMDLIEMAKSCDIIFFLMNDQVTIDDNHQDPWLRRKLRGFVKSFNDVLDDDIQLRIKLFFHECPEFREIQTDSPLERIRQTLKDWVVAIFGDPNVPPKPEIPKKRLVVMSPQYQIPSLQLNAFVPGDITNAIKQGFQQAEKILDELGF